MKARIVLHQLIAISLCLGLYGCLRDGQKVTLYSYTCSEGEEPGFFNKSYYAIYPETQVVVRSSVYGGASKLEDCSVYDKNNWSCWLTDDSRMDVAHGRQVFNWTLEYQHHKSVTIDASAVDYWLSYLRETSGMEKLCRLRLQIAKKSL